MTTRIGTAAQTLARRNPWWRDARWVEQDSDLRDAAAVGIAYHATCLDGLAEGGLYVLRGPRRVGKTVAVKEAIERLQREGVPPRSIVHVAADGMEAAELRTIIQNTALPPVSAGQRRWWFFDEITKTTGDWAGVVKLLRDNEPDFRGSTVVLTGSDANELTAATGALAGRRGRVDGTDRTLLPIGFRTFTHLVRPGVDWPELTLGPGELRTRAASDAFGELVPWLDELVSSFEAYLSYGGFPVAVGAAKEATDVPRWFLDDLFGVIFHDAFRTGALSESRAMSLFTELMQAMAAPANLSRIASTVGVDQKTVARHVAYLHNAYLVWRCPQKDEGVWLARERAQDKVYAVDPLLARLPYLRDTKGPDVDPTVLVEQQVGMALCRRLLAEGQHWDGEPALFHLRTPARREIDFVSAALQGVALEAKYTEGRRWRGAAATVDASAFDGILLTRNVLDCSDAKRAWAVPAGVLAYLIDT